MSSRLPRVIACCLLWFGFFPVVSSDAVAQLSGQISPQPVAVFYMRNINERRMFSYLEDLTSRMKFAEAFIKETREQNSSDEMKEKEAKVDQPIAGAALYLVDGAIPNVETVWFVNVADAEDAKRVLTAETRGQWGERGGLKDVGNDCYVISMIQEKSWTLPEGADESEFAKTKRVTKIDGVTQASFEMSTEVEEKDSKKVIKESTINRQFHRVHDGILYTGESEKLFEMTLPSSAEIGNSIGGTNDLGYSIYLDRVPETVRQVGWTMLSAALGTQMQQQDGESDTTYNMRRASGDLGLAILNTAIFDIDYSDASIQFANQDVPSILGNLRIRARNNSGLGGKLERATGSSGFASILSDNAAVTGHACVRLAEESSLALTSTGDYLKEVFAAEFANDSAMNSVASSLAETLTGIAEHRNLEMLFKIGWSEESAGVVYGGIQLDSNPQLLGTLQTFFARFAGDFSDTISAIETIDDNGISFIRITFTQGMVDEFAESFGAKISHIYLAHQNSCLWYAAGGENAKEIIRLSLAKCNESSAARTAFMTARIDMERWLSYPQNDPTGIAQMPDWLDSNSWFFPPNPLVWMQGGGEQRLPQPVMQRAFDLGGAQQFWMTLEADESGLLLQLSLGEALANHMAARFIDLADDTQTEPKDVALPEIEEAFTPQ